MFCHIFHSPQMKGCAIITYKHGIDKMRHKLRNDMRVRILGNSEISRNCLNYIE